MQVVGLPDGRGNKTKKLLFIFNKQHTNTVFLYLHFKHSVWQAGKVKKEQTWNKDEKYYLYWAHSMESWLMPGRNAEYLLADVSQCSHVNLILVQTF